jgi:cell division protein FtsZ
MADELKVTVVATGLANSMDKPVKVVDNTTKTVDGTTDYNKLDRPTITRRRASVELRGNTAVDTKTSEQPSVDYLDIPAFLRRQAD